jgi:hypothetical protein
MYLIKNIIQNCNDKNLIVITMIGVKIKWR